MKSENLNFMEPSGPLEACNGTALPFDITSFGLKRPSSGQYLQKRIQYDIVVSDGVNIYFYFINVIVET